MFRDEDWSVWSVDMAKPERPAPSTNFISLANPDGRHTDQRSQSTPVMFNNGGLKAVETNNSPKTYTFDALDNVQQSQWQNLHQEKSSVYLSEIPEPHYR
ncbi:MAG: hypothetical protein IKW74_05455 [Thermoguttaceae bacterium]|nr:hypothetical protein [Thermoguttaceae bacterium]